MPPQIAYDAPFHGTERFVSIPLTHVAPPNLAQCRGCLGGTMAWGYVVVVPPGNREPVSKDTIVGMGQMMLAHTRYAAQQAPLLRDKFPAGVAEGTAPYHVRRGHQSMFDSLFLAPPGSVFDLVVCNATAGRCKLPMPNPS